MITWTNLYQRAQDITGVPTTDTTTTANLQADINQGLRIFKNASRRYWTRKEASTNVVASQQYYQLPPDAVRVTEVRTNTGAGGYNWPMVQIDSEDLWNRYNIIPSNTVIVPQFFFIRGNNEIGLYPIPSTNVTNGLIVSYESRTPDMNQEDVTTGTCTVANGATTVSFSNTIITQQMVGRWFQVTDGTDGNWYQIGIFDSSSQVDLGNDYVGISGSGRSFIIGQAPDIPEDYHMALVYYAAYNFYLKRNENENSLQYKGLFEDLLQQYKDNYAAKTTGLVQKPQSDNIFNIFYLPPGTITG